MNNVQLCRCESCGTIATSHRKNGPDGEEYSCAEHAVGEGWVPICSIQGCGGTPAFVIEYKVSDTRVLLMTCVEHFQGMPNNVSEVFRLGSGSLA